MFTGDRTISAQKSTLVNVDVGSRVGETSHRFHPGQLLCYSTTAASTQKNVQVSERGPVKRNNQSQPADGFLFLLWISFYAKYVKDTYIITISTEAGAQASLTKGGRGRAGVFRDLTPNTWTKALVGRTQERCFWDSRATICLVVTKTCWEKNKNMLHHRLQVSRISRGGRKESACVHW